jgi:DNA-binding response OmpR family regulator
MNRARILVVEDDANIRAGLLDLLAGEGHEPTPAADGPEALALFAKRPFDLVLLDIMMPGLNGYDVCREIRRRSTAVPVLMLTAKGEEPDKVVGLQLGADDYITKPFGARELAARVAAALRRARQAGAEAAERTSPADRFAFGPAEVDARKFTCRLGKKCHALTAREVALLRFFHARPGDVLTRDDILNAVWGIAYQGTTRTLDQHIAQLRKKIEPRPDQPKTLLTVHGAGYRYQPDKSG